MPGEHTITLSEYELHFLWEAINDYQLKHKDDLKGHDAETVNDLCGLLESLIQDYLQEEWEAWEEEQEEARKKKRERI